MTYDLGEVYIRRALSSQARAVRAFALLRVRIEAASLAGRQLVVFSHYPTKFLRSWREPASGQTFGELLQRASVRIPRSRFTYDLGEVYL